MLPDRRHFLHPHRSPPPPAAAADSSTLYNRLSIFPCFPASFNPPDFAHPFMSVAPPAAAPPLTAWSWTNWSCLHGNFLLISHCVIQSGSPFFPPSSPPSAPLPCQNDPTCCPPSSLFSPRDLSIAPGATVVDVLIVASLLIYCDTELHQTNVILPCMYGCCLVRRLGVCLYNALYFGDT